MAEACGFESVRCRNWYDNMKYDGQDDEGSSFLRVSRVWSVRMPGVVVASFLHLPARPPPARATLWSAHSIPTPLKNDSGASSEMKCDHLSGAGALQNGAAHRKGVRMPSFYWADPDRRCMTSPTTRRMSAKNWAAGLGRLGEFKPRPGNEASTRIEEAV